MNKNVLATHGSILKIEADISILMVVKIDVHMKCKIFI